MIGMRAARAGEQRPTAGLLSLSSSAPRPPRKSSRSVGKAEVKGHGTSLGRCFWTRAKREKGKTKPNQNPSSVISGRSPPWCFIYWLGSAAPPSAPRSSLGTRPEETSPARPPILALLPPWARLFSLPWEAAEHFLPKRGKDGVLHFW